MIALLAAFAGVSAAAVRTADYIPSEQPEFPTCDPFKKFHADDFPPRPSSDNKWLPLAPGTQFVLEGRANRGGGPLPHTVVFTVTDLTKVIDGVRTRVLWDVDSNQGTVQEAELAFFAEDWSNRIWLFGEYPEEYDAGVFKGAPSTWLAGVASAEPGVQLPANLWLNRPSYVQGFAPDVGFFDCGKNIIRGEHVCVPVGCFDDVAVVEEWAPLDPAGGFQRKFYAPWVGNISIGAVDDPEGETLVLSKVNKLDREGLKAARAEALKLDERAYLVSDVWRDTDPAEPGGKRPVIPPAAPGAPPSPPATTSVPTPPVLSGSATKPKSKPKKSKKRKRCVAKRRRAGKHKGAKAKRRCAAKKRRR